MAKIILRLLILIGFYYQPLSAQELPAAAQYLQQNSDLTAQDFKELWRIGSQQAYLRKPVCRINSTSQRVDIPSVFLDPVFEKQFGKDPLLQKINTYLYFNDAAKLVSADDLPRFIQYAKSFYLLFKQGRFVNPDLRVLNRDKADYLDGFAFEDKALVLKKPTTPEAQLAYKIVVSENSPAHFSSIMVGLFAKAARAESICNMTTTEVTALSIYTGMGFVDLNKYLRSLKSNNSLLNTLELLINNALDKIENTERLVFRTTKFWGQPDMLEEKYRRHAANHVVIYDGFTSTSSEPMLGANFLIYSRTGKLLGPLSMEREILFKSHTRFNVRYNSCQEEALPVWQGCNVILEEVSQ